MTNHFILIFVDSSWSIFKFYEATLLGSSVVENLWFFLKSHLWWLWIAKDKDVFLSATPKPAFAVQCATLTKCKGRTHGRGDFSSLSSLKTISWWRHSGSCRCFIKMTEIWTDCGADLQCSNGDFRHETLRRRTYHLKACTHSWANPCRSVLGYPVCRGGSSCCSVNC